MGSHSATIDVIDVSLSLARENLKIYSYLRVRDCNKRYHLVNPNNSSETRGTNVFHGRWSGRETLLNDHSSGERIKRCAFVARGWKMVPKKPDDDSSMTDGVLCCKTALARPRRAAPAFPAVSPDMVRALTGTLNARIKRLLAPRCFQNGYFVSWKWDRKRSGITRQTAAFGDKFSSLAALLMQNYLRRVEKS